jgi:DNA-binding transcriptional ArsR family regulator
MDKFFALAAPIRREIIAILSDGDQLTATMIAEKFQLTPAAISQHLKVLLNSKLVRMHKDAQKRIYELNPIGIAELEQWASQIATQLSKVNPLPQNKSSVENEEIA